MDVMELLEAELRDIYDAEKQITKALPKMAKKATDDQLKEAFQHHLDQTQEHVLRLEQVFGMLGLAAKGKPCKGMKGLIEEGKEAIDEHGKGAELDTLMIAAAQRVEHYEMAAYGTARAMAEKAGQDEAAVLLQQTADEEGATDKLLTEISLRIMEEQGDGAGDLREEEQKLAARKSASSARKAKTSSSGRSTGKTGMAGRRR